MAPKKTMKSAEGKNTATGKTTTPGAKKKIVKAGVKSVPQDIVAVAGNKAYEVKQNFTLGVAIEDLGKMEGIRLMITGMASGTDGLSTFAARALQASNVAGSIKQAGKTTLSEMKLYQPNQLGNPAKKNACFVATVKGGTPRRRAKAIDTVWTTLMDKCLFSIHVNVPP